MQYINTIRPYYQPQTQRFSTQPQKTPFLASVKDKFPENFTNILTYAPIRYEGSKSRFNRLEVRYLPHGFSQQDWIENKACFTIENPGVFDGSTYSIYMDGSVVQDGGWQNPEQILPAGSILSDDISKAKLRFGLN